MRRLIAVICAVAIVIPASSYAEKYAGEFMAMGGGARAMGMGGTFLAIADDATATFWNPAGIAYISSMYGSPNNWEMNLMHSERFGDLIDYNYFSAIFPLEPGKSGWGITAIHMGIDDIRIIPLESGMIGGDGANLNDRYERELGEYLNFNYEDFPLESVNDIAVFLSYAQIMDFGSFGASVKLIRNDQVTGVSSLGIGFDVGFLKRDLYRDLLLGVKLQDATGTYINWSTGKKEYIYPALKLGAAYPLQLKQMNSRLVLAVDADFRYENRKSVSQFWIGRASADFHLGAELIIREVVALRGGLDMGRPTAGAGFILREFGPWNVSLGIDYALLVHDVFDATHRVSLTLAH